MLNVYKVSGLPKVGAVEGKYSFWNAGTVDYTNTRAFNYLLADVNAKLLLISKGIGDIADLYNNVDADIVCLEALLRNKQDPELYPLDFLGMVIAEMQHEGMFASVSTDDIVRSNNLDMLLDHFEARLNDTLTGAYSTTFIEWWNTEIVPNNYNGNSEEVIARFNEVFSNGKIGEVVNIPNPEDFTSMTDYIKASGPCFLYMFIPEEEKDKYNRVINWKRKKEYEETYAYIKKNTGSMYTDAGIKSLFAQGIVEYWGVTPKQKLDEVLANGGQVGGLTVAEIVAIVSVVIAALSFLLGLIQSVFQITYSVAENANQYVPDDSDLTGMLNSEKSTAGITNKLGTTGLIAGAAILFAILYNSDN